MKTWLLTAGRYADYTVVAVLIGTKRDAEKAAEAITLQRAKVDRPVDMTKVNVEEIMRVNARGERVSG